jgi:predicted RNA binding protein YcfA (HicA-like mRNA interferase family)
MKVRDIIKLLENDGWRRKNFEGGHRHFVHPTKPGKTTVSGHPSDEVAPGTLKSIMREAGLNR